MIALIVYLVFVGLVVGGLARLALPGPDPIGVLGTLGLGLAGPFTAGLIAGLLWNRPAGFVLSVVAATGLLYGYRRVVQKRGLTGPSARNWPPRS